MTWTGEWLGYRKELERLPAGLYWTDAHQIVTEEAERRGEITTVVIPCWDEVEKERRRRGLRLVKMDKEAL